MFTLLFPIFLCIDALVFASTTITTYSDDHCSIEISNIIGPENGSSGICQENTLESSNYTSFRVSSADPGYVVTFYASDKQDCSSNNRWAAQVGTCYNNSSIAQFSVDYSGPASISTQAAGAAPSQPPSTLQTSTTSSMTPTETSTGKPGATSSTSSNPVASSSSINNSAGGLSNGQILGLEVALPTIVAVAGVIATIIFGVRHWNSKS